MRIENFKRGVVSILLVFALVSSIISVAPLATPGNLIYPPPTTIEVVQGDNFLIRHVLEFDQPENGSYTVTISWLNYDNKPEENLTFLMAEAYYTADNSYQQADVTMAWIPSGSDTSYALSVARPADNKDPRNGQFNVDIWMGAYGAGGIPHIPTDNYLIQGGVIVFESSMDSWDYLITIKVLPRQLGVNVDISPTQQGGLTGATLTHTVTVTNIGTVDDNYDLAVSDNENWGPTLSENLLENVAPGENRTVTLSVTIPSGAIGTIDNITITATSQENSAIYDNIRCSAHRSKAKFVNKYIEPDKLRTLYEVWLDINALLRDDASELVLKFYTWGGSFQGENVVSTTMPAILETLWKNPHPTSSTTAVEKVELVLEDAQGTEIQTITTFIVTKTILEIRFGEIPLHWALNYPPGRADLEREFTEIPLKWALAPS